MFRSFFQYLRAHYRFRLDLRLSPTARHQMIQLAMRYVRFNQIEGDYYEFGVWNGDTFAKACTTAMRFMKFPHMRFLALDSFEGFSEPQGHDALGVIEKGDYAFSLDDFKARLVRDRIDMSRVEIVPGWFAESLTAETKKRHRMGKAAIINLDVDLYEPTRDALAFSTELMQDGTLLMVDDWHFFRGHPQRGAQRAFHEWRAAHPELLVSEFADYNWCGKAFVINFPLDDTEGVHS